MKILGDGKRKLNTLSSGISILTICILFFFSCSDIFKLVYREIIWIKMITVNKCFRYLVGIYVLKIHNILPWQIIYFATLLQLLWLGYDKFVYQYNIKSEYKTSFLQLQTPQQWAFWPSHNFFYLYLSLIFI